MCMKVHGIWFQDADSCNYNVSGLWCKVFNGTQKAAAFTWQNDLIICVFRVTGLKILGRVGIPFFLIIFFFQQKCLSKCIKLYFFQKT